MTFTTALAFSLALYALIGTLSFFVLLRAETRTAAYRLLAGEVRRLLRRTR